MKVLCCGGTADGQWRELTSDVRDFRIPKHVKFDWMSNQKVEVDDSYDEYRVVDIQILGFGMKVAMLRGTPDEGLAVLKSLVQRDVFEHLSNPKRKRGW